MWCNCTINDSEASFLPKNTTTCFLREKACVKLKRYVRFSAAGDNLHLSVSMNISLILVFCNVIECCERNHQQQ